MIDPTKSPSTQPYRTTAHAQAIAKTIISVDEAIEVIKNAWPQAYERGRLLHIHQNAIRLKGGSIVHLRVLVQQISEAEAELHNDKSLGDD